MKTLNQANLGPLHHTKASHGPVASSPSKSLDPPTRSRSHSGRESQETSLLSVQLCSNRDQLLSDFKDYPPLRDMADRVVDDTEDSIFFLTAFKYAALTIRRTFFVARVQKLAFSDASARLQDEFESPASSHYSKDDLREVLRTLLKLESIQFEPLYGIGRDLPVFGLTSITDGPFRYQFYIDLRTIHKGKAAFASWCSTHPTDPFKISAGSLKDEQSSSASCHLLRIIFHLYSTILHEWCAHGFLRKSGVLPTKVSDLKLTPMKRMMESGRCLSFYFFGAIISPVLDTTRCPDYNKQLQLSDGHFILPSRTILCFECFIGVPYLLLPMLPS